jgi:hypothetical protein
MDHRRRLGAARPLRLGRRRRRADRQGPDEGLGRRPRAVPARRDREGACEPPARQHQAAGAGAHHQALPRRDAPPAVDERGARARGQTPAATDHSAARSRDHGRDGVRAAPDARRARGMTSLLLGWVPGAKGMGAGWCPAGSFMGSPFWPKSGPLMRPIRAGAREKAGTARPASAARAARAAGMNLRRRPRDAPRRRCRLRGWCGGRGDAAPPLGPRRSR